MRITEAVRGMTLIEVLVAISIFAVVIAFVTPALLSNIALTQKSRQQSERTLVAQRVLEQVKTAWRDPNAYALMCVPDFTLPDGVKSLQTVPLDHQIGADDPSNDQVNQDLSGDILTCSANPPVASDAQIGAAPNMRRIVITTASGDTTAQTIMDVLQP